MPRSADTAEKYLVRCVTFLLEHLARFEGLARAHTVAQLNDGWRREARIAWQVVRLTDRWPDSQGKLKALKLTLQGALKGQGIERDVYNKLVPLIMVKLAPPPKSSFRMNRIRRAKVVFNMLTAVPVDRGYQGVRGPLRKLLLETKPESLTL